MPDYNVFVTHQLTNEVQYIKENTLIIEKKMRRHIDVSKQYKAWFDQTPQFGRYMVMFDLIRLAYSSVKGSRQFHKGIDILHVGWCTGSGNG